MSCSAMKAASSLVTRSGKPSSFLPAYAAAEPRSAWARCAAGVKTVSKFSGMADLPSAKSKRNPRKNEARLRERLLLLDHLPALVADLVLVVFEAGQQHARVVALALAEFHHVRPAGGALLRRALGERNRWNNQKRNKNTQTRKHQRSFRVRRVNTRQSCHQHGR